jgi:hypothetical protein
MVTYNLVGEETANVSVPQISYGIDGIYSCVFMEGLYVFEIKGDSIEFYMKNGSVIGGYGYSCGTITRNGKNSYRAVFNEAHGRTNTPIYKEIDSTYSKKGDIGEVQWSGINLTQTGNVPLELQKPAGGWAVWDKWNMALSISLFGQYEFGSVTGNIGANIHSVGLNMQTLMTINQPVSFALGMGWFFPFAAESTGYEMDVDLLLGAGWFYGNDRVLFQAAGGLNAVEVFIMGSDMSTMVGLGVGGVTHLAYRISPLVTKHPN